MCQIMEQSTPKVTRVVRTLVEPYENCLSMEMYGELEAQQEEIRIRLCLSIKFGREEITLLEIGGLQIANIQIGIRGGELQLELEQCRMPTTSMKLINPLINEIEIDAESEETTTSNLGVQANPEKIEGSVSRERENTTRNAFKFSKYQIKAKGGERSPTWEFEVETGQPILEGVLKDETLGILHVESSACAVTASFQVFLKDISLSAGKTGGILFKNPFFKDLSFKDLSPEKRGTLDRLIALYLLKPHEYFSQLCITYS